jgi:hypothetical protein
LGFENEYGWPIRLGNGEEIGTKLALSRTLTDYLLSRGVAPRFIDVRYLDTPYYGE